MTKPILPFTSSEPTMTKPTTHQSLTQIVEAITSLIAQVENFASVIDPNIPQEEGTITQTVDKLIVEGLTEEIIIPLKMMKASLDDETGPICNLVGIRDFLSAGGIDAQQGEN